MAIDSKGADNLKFVTVNLPRLAGAGGLLLYFLTLNPWVSFFNVGNVLQISGWSWQPQVSQPLTTLLLFPFRLLPDSWVPLALNVFTALCAVLVLSLLARSVALLPHDLLPDARFRKDEPDAMLATRAAWVPPLMAVLICGLQLSFWEHATSASGEMIDVLVLACVVRCLLEFRVSRNSSWLFHAALVFGAGMANHWAFLILFPVFVAAIVRMKGITFLNRPFLLRMTVCGLIGLSLYLLLPVLHALRTGDPVGFWTALKVHLKFQKAALFVLQNFSMRSLAWLLLLALVLLSLRWKPLLGQGGYDSRLGGFLTRAAGHFIHGLILVASLWLALDPVFSPRHAAHGGPLLLFYYLSALMCGYCAGYFLMLNAARIRERGAIVGAIATCALFAILPPVLLVKNFGQIRITNGPALHEFARQLYADLPAGKCVVLSDDPLQLFLLQAELSAHAGEKDPVLVETVSLFRNQYQNVMAERYKARWPETTSTNRQEIFTRAGVMKLISALAAREPVVYLHPSFGLVLESFAEEPAGFVHTLSPRPANAIAAERLAGPVVAANELLWQRRWTNNLQTLAQHTGEHPRCALIQPLLKTLHVPPARNSTAATIGVLYAKSLDYWGVKMQEQGQWAEAGVWFGRALELNPDNIAARINAEFNTRYQRGESARLNLAALRDQESALSDRLENWRGVLDSDGPVDEPTSLLRSGRILLDSGFPVQAAASFARSSKLAPQWPAAKLWLAESYVALRDFAGALTLTDSMQGAAEGGLSKGAVSQLLRCRVRAFRGLGRTNDAAECLQAFVGKYDEHKEVLSTAANLYGGGRLFEKELDVLEVLLNREPNDAELLARKGLAQMRLRRLEEAIATLTLALTIAPSNERARLHRAVAYLGSGQLEDAQRDYEELLRGKSTSPSALFGLASVAWRQHDTNTAIQYYQQYLSSGASDSPQAALAAERLRQLSADQ